MGALQWLEAAEFILIPTQIAQARQARALASGKSIPDRYWRHNRTLGGLGRPCYNFAIGESVFKP